MAATTAVERKLKLQRVQLFDKTIRTHPAEDRKGATRFHGLASRYEVTAVDATADGVERVVCENWKWHPRLALPSRDNGLVAHNFSALWRDKCAAHLPGTREWAFKEVTTWLKTPGESKLFWLVGGGGTGKSVVAAELLRREFDRVAAWHFCRHDDKEKSTPAALVRSLAAMLCHTLPGFEDALDGTKT